MKKVYNMSITIEKKDWSSLDYETRRQLEDNDIWQYSGTLYINGEFVAHEKGGSEAYLIQELSDHLYRHIAK